MQGCAWHAGKRSVNYYQYVSTFDRVSEHNIDFLKPVTSFQVLHLMLEGRSLIARGHYEGQAEAKSWYVRW